MLHFLKDSRFFSTVDSLINVRNKSKEANFANFIFLPFGIELHEVVTKIWCLMLVILYSHDLIQIRRIMEEIKVPV